MPELKQFADLLQRDFVRNPAWVNCHVIDYDEPWYDKTDEETYRPCTFPVPVDPDVDWYLIKASATLANGHVLPGFMTPDQWEWEGTDASEKMGYVQPYVFLPSGDMVGFWEGWRGTDAVRIEEVTADRMLLYTAVELKSSEVFPILFETEPQLTAFPSSITVEGFYFITELGTYENPRSEVGIEQ